MYFIVSIRFNQFLFNFNWCFYLEFICISINYIFKELSDYIARLSFQLISLLKSCSICSSEVLFSPVVMCMFDEATSGEGLLNNLRSNSIERYSIAVIHFPIISFILQLLNFINIFYLKYLLNANKISINIFFIICHRDMNVCRTL